MTVDRRDSSAAADLESLVPRPALIGRGDPYPSRTQVVAVQFGTFLGLHSERLQVKREGTVVDEVPLFRLSELVVGARGVILSADLIRELCVRGIRMLFLGSTGTPYAMLCSPMLTATVQTRRAQMAAFEDERGTRFARAVVAGKLHNQANLLKYFAKYLAGADENRFREVRELASKIEALLPRVGGKRTAPAAERPAEERPGEPTSEHPDPLFDAAEEAAPAACAVPAGPAGLRPTANAFERTQVRRQDRPAGAPRAAGGECIDRERGALLAVEGAAGRLYWRGFQLLVGAERFEGRRHRGAADPVNAALNYGYGILYSKVWASLMVAGLEPFAGFLHVDRPGKPSLVLDVVEEYRQPVVDRTVVAIFTRGTQVGMENGRLDLEARREVASRVLARLETPVPYEGKKVPLRAVMQAQAHHLAMAFRGERRYRPYRFRW